AMLRVTNPKVICVANVVTYRDTAIQRMTDYCQTAMGNGDDGIAACGQCYLDTYNDVGVPTPHQRRTVHINYRRAVAATPPGHNPPPSPTVPRMPFVESVYRAIESEVREACATEPQLNIGDYLS